MLSSLQRTGASLVPRRLALGAYKNSLTHHGGGGIANRWMIRSATSSNSATRATTSRSWMKAGGALAVAATVAAQYKYGRQKDFFDYRFYTTVDPDDLASFYGSEAFMDLFCVMPFMGTLMMRGGYFDEEGTVHTTGFPGEMQVSMVFSDDDDEEGTTKWFNKRERFRDVLFGFTCWDMVTNFGFERQDDGRLLVYHHGEYFHGSFPPLSLLVRLIFGVHARWVAWATEHHINHYAFRNESELDEEFEEQSRVDMPLFLIRNYAWSDLMAGMWGSKVEKPSFMVLKSAQAALEAEDEQEEEEMELPIHRPAIQRRITVDIRLDRQNTRAALMDDDDVAAKSDSDTDKTEVPLEVALQRTRTLTRRLTQREDASKPVPTLQPRETLGGNAAWETLRATNDPKAYKALTTAAKERQLQRRETQKTTEKDQ